MFEKLTGLLDFAKDMGANLLKSDAEAGMNIVMHIEANNPGVNPINAKFDDGCLLYTSPSPRDATLSRMPSSA